MRDLRGQVSGLGTVAATVHVAARAAIAVDRMYLGTGRWPRRGARSPARVPCDAELDGDVDRRRRAPRRARRARVHGAHRGGRGDPAAPRALRAARAAAPAAQPRRDPRAARSGCPACPRSRASTRRSTARCPRWRSASRCRRASLTRACAATDSTASRTSTSPRSCRTSTARGRQRAHGGVPPRQRRQHVRAAGRAAASATTMGFTAVDGLPMGTRCGALDPGVVLFMMDELRMSAREIERLIYTSRACSACPACRATCATCSRATRLPRALALDCVRLPARRELGSLAAALGGLDAIVFTAGHRREPAGDPRAHLPAGARGSASNSTAKPTDARAAHHRRRAARWRPRSIPTDEESMIARHVARPARVAPRRRDLLRGGEPLDSGARP